MGLGRSFGLGLALLLPMGAGVGSICYHSHIKMNLEEDALDCGLTSALPDWSTLLPHKVNRDIDDDGLYESVVIYEDDGQKKFQQISKDIFGNLTLGIPRDWK